MFSKYLFPFFAIALAIFTTAAHADNSPAAIADKSHYLADFCRLAEAQWPTNRTLTIVCHGHSVPAGYFKTPDVRTMDAYPHLLHASLKHQFPYAVMNVIVTAIGGENSESGAVRFDRDVLSLRPDIITIDYGLNDRHLGLEKARASWKTMIEHAQAKGIKVLLLTPTPDTSAKLSDSNDPLNQHATQIRALAAEYHVGLVDSLAAFKSAIAAGQELSGLMSQINHPNRQGHELVEASLLKWFPKP